MHTNEDKSSPGALRDPELARLQQEWSPAWTIWRARRPDDPPGVRSGSYMATRMRKDAGRDPTVMCASAAQLDAELTEQQHLAGQRIRM